MRCNCAATCSAGFPLRHARVNWGIRCLEAIRSTPTTPNQQLSASPPPCSDPSGWLDLSLHVTGSSAHAIELTSNGGQAHLPRKSSSGGSFKAADSASCNSSVKDPSEAETEDAQLLAPHTQRTASPFFWSMLR